MEDIYQNSMGQNRPCLYKTIKSNKYYYNNIIYI